MQNSRIPPLYGVRGGFPPGEMRDSHQAPGAGQHMICSDCYDNANIYSRTREYCPYTYMTEEDPMDQTLSSFMAQVPKDTFLSHSNE
ncbi:unnamed protein product, partial [Staurois parvus]